jgi:predicted O-linked N-acetylglucosamine transferase (SPINDLY family)
MNNINIDLEVKEFKEYIINGLMYSKNEFFIIIQKDILKIKLDIENFCFTEIEVIKLINDNSSSLLSSILIIYVTGKNNLPYVQWMYISYAIKKWGNIEELNALKVQIKLKMESTFPFLKNQKELPSYLIEKYCLDAKKINAPLLLSARSAEIIFNNSIKKNEEKNALYIALLAYIKFNESAILIEVVKILYNFKQTNDALKALVLLTYLKPLDCNSILMWGTISIHMISTRNYWVAKLGYLIFPDNHGILLNLSVNLGSLGYFKKSKILLEKAINSPRSPNAYLINYANLLMSEGRPDAGVKILEKAEKAEKKYNEKISSNLLFISQYDPNVDYFILKERHIKVSKNFKKIENENQEICLDNNNDNKIRIGFISFDLINHPVANYIYPLIKNLSRDDFDLYIYYTRQRKDSVTRLFMDLVGENFIDVSAKTTKEQYATIKANNLDILVDLAGHTAGNSLEIFATKPAKFQATYVGYPFTVGLDEIEYRFSDFCFADDRNYYTEKRIDVEGSAHCYQPMIGNLGLLNSDLYKVKKPPVLKNGYITFGLSSNPGKINDKVVEVFCSILKNVQESRLLIEAIGFSDLEYLESYKQRFTNFGIEDHRILLKSRDSAKQYLIYNEIDIALDPFPYNGGTSTLDLLWMGLPLVTLEGIAGMSIVGSAYLKQMGKLNWIATDINSYIKIATELATNIDNLVEERSLQRNIMERSNLMNQAKFANNFGQALKKIVFDKSDIINR